MAPLLTNTTTAATTAKAKETVVNVVFEKSPDDRNDHSKDWDEVGARTEIVSLVASQVIWGMAVLFIIGLYLAHLYYKREKREQYAREREVMISELRRRRSSLLFGALITPVERVPVEEIRPIEAMPALVSRWNSIMHIFYSFRV